MSDQIEYAGFEASEFAVDPEPRVPCVLLLDVSGSMSGQPIAEAERRPCYAQGHPRPPTPSPASEAELAIVTFGGSVNNYPGLRHRRAFPAAANLARVGRQPWARPYSPAST